MGVLGLKNYIYQTAGIIEQINICDEIKKWVIDHESQKPIIVIDFKGFIYNSLVDDDMNIFLGIRGQKYIKKMMQFFQKLQDAGAKLVFFMVGRRYIEDAYWSKIGEIVKEFNRTYQVYILTMDAMESSYILEKRILFGTTMTSTMRYNLERICQKNVGSQFHVTHKFHNREIGEFLTKNDPNVLAIISDDTDFMIVDGRFQYWSLEQLNFRELNCYRYSKADLSSKLNLSPTKIHSINVLSGNKMSGPMNDALRNGFRRKILEIKEWFNPRIEQQYLQEENDDFLEYCKNYHPKLFRLLTYRVLKLREMASVDYRKFNQKSFANLIIPIVMKLCGVLNKDASDRPLTRQIFAKFAHDESWTLKDEQIVYPKMELPSLTDLIMNHEKSEFNHVRCSLFDWVLDLDDDMLIAKVRSLEQPNHIKVTIITLQYLLKERELQPDEAFVILLTGLEQMKPSERYCVVYPQNADVNVNFAHIAHFFPKIYVWVNYALDICGLSKMTDLIYFDGPAFHNMMTKFEQAVELEKDEMRSKVEAIWTFD